VETGRLGYRVGFIPATVYTDVPERLRPWLRQRLAWAGGQFRLFVVNFRFAWWHPFLWFYGAEVTWMALVLRFQQVFGLNWRIVGAITGYVVLVLFLYPARARRAPGGCWPCRPTSLSTRS
jgi:cellulose synthase/poly-beta-1,6-N-acetylglucosamine synthase-like glycosyltransferase